MTSHIFIRTFTGLYGVYRTRGGPLGSDWVDFPETAQRLPPARASFQCPSRNLVAGTIRPRRAITLAQQQAWQRVFCSRPLRGIVHVRNVCSAPSRPIEEHICKCCQPSSRCLVCELSASQPGPGNASRDPHFPISSAASLAWDE